MGQLNEYATFGDWLFGELIKEINETKEIIKTNPELKDFYMSEEDCNSVISEAKRLGYLKEDE